MTETDPKQYLKEELEAIGLQVSDQQIQKLYQYYELVTEKIR